jgi:hypothetical protein
MSDKLKRIYNEADALSHEIPAELSKKITLYTRALLIVGRYHADAVRAHGKAYAERKRVWGETILSSSGTAKDKEGMAEKECYPYRVQEADAEGEMWTWRNAYNSTQEVINALKKELDTLMVEYGKTG